MLFGGGVGGWMLGSGAPIKRIMHCPGDRRINEAQTRTSARAPLPTTDARKSALAPELRVCAARFGLPQRSCYLACKKTWCGARTGGALGSATEGVEVSGSAPMS
jgi:hypothetical protein